MITTHPILFNVIAVLFVAFTAGWIVFAFNNRVIMKLRDRIRELEEKVG